MLIHKVYAVGVRNIFAEVIKYYFGKKMDEYKLFD